MADIEVGTLQTPDKIEATPRGLVQRWLAELSMAETNDKEWQDEGQRIYDLYTAKETKANSFNILWSNTETLRPAIYNSTPTPDVRRRFRDEDRIGKVAADVLERSLSYQIDAYDFNAEIEAVALDVLIPGRGVARVNYAPQFAQVSQEGVSPAPTAGAYAEQSAEPQEGAPALPQESEQEGQSLQPLPGERIIAQDAKCSYVYWKDFRCSPEKQWKDKSWIAFRHDFTQDMAEEKFGKQMALSMEYSQPAASKDLKNKPVKEMFKVCETWEIWDRAKRRVLFIAPSHAASALAEIPDPLKLNDFFPMPRPVIAIENNESPTPIPLYRMYEEQAKELDRVSARINKITNALKVRGAYSSHIKEAANILTAGDNDMVPIENPSVVSDAGGLDKLIWIMPINVLAATLKELYLARDQIKQAIYEITGIADILRGATNPNETLGAQKIKSEWGSLRIQRIQRDIQRFVRDLLRIKAEIISEHFTQEHLSAMSGVKLATQEQKQQGMQLAQQGVQLPPEAQELAQKPSWDEVMQLLRSDQMRQYRIDIETGSTVAETVSSDMEGLSEAMGAIGKLIAESMPAVQSGMLSVDAVKELCLVVSRRSRMGLSLEDAIDKMQPPKPEPEEQQQPDNSLQVAQVKAQSDQAMAQMDAQNKQQIAQMQEQTKMQIAQMESAAEAQRTQMQAQADGQKTAMEAQFNAQFERQKMELDAAVKIIVAQISATKAVEMATAKNAEREFSEGVQ